MLSGLLLNRGDKGLSLHGKIFDLPQMTQTYHYVVPCKACQGQKASRCDRCHGGKQETCGQCHGRRSVGCSQCRGSGQMKDQNGQSKSCSQCFGKSSIQCPLCRARGVVVCRICKGAGNIKCHVCKGVGASSFSTTVTYKMNTIFEIDRSALPDGAIKMIENKGAELVKNNHIDLSAEQVKREDGGLAIQYELKFPYGNITLNLNGNPIKMHIFGRNMKVMKATNFVDQLVEKNYALLLRAANNDGNVISHVNKGSKSRLIADGLLEAVSTRPKLAMMNLKKKYPYGVSNDLLKDVVLKSNKALSNVTQKSRYGGLLVGFCLSAFVMAGYFYTGLRQMLGLEGQVAWFADFSLVGIGVVLVVLLSKYLATRPLKKALGGLLPENKRSQFKPRTNSNYVAAVLGNVVLLILIAYLARFVGAVSPSWMIF